MEVQGLTILATVLIPLDNTFIDNTYIDTPIIYQ